MEKTLTVEAEKKIKAEAEELYPTKKEFFEQNVQSQNNEFRQEGYIAAASKYLPQGEGWISESQAVEILTAAMREADRIYEGTGGGTRHYVRDVLLPILQEKGFYLSPLLPAPPNQKGVGRGDGYVNNPIDLINDPEDD